MTIVRTHGSGSAGMTNMLRTYGIPAGAATAIGDVAKGAVAVFIGEWIFTLLAPDLGPACGAYLAAIFAAVGHMKPVWFGFKGGKGVLVCGGAILALQPLVFLALLVIFLIEFAITRIVSLGSIILAAIYPVLTICYWVWQGGGSVHACVYRRLQRDHGADGHLHAPLEHPAPARGYRVPLWRKEKQRINGKIKRPVRRTLRPYRPFFACALGGNAYTRTISRVISRIVCAPHMAIVSASSACSLST